MYTIEIFIQQYLLGWHKPQSLGARVVSYATEAYMVFKEGMVV